jgi:predicted PurR-regulated permease PerM
MKIGKEKAIYTVNISFSTVIKTSLFFLLMYLVFFLQDLVLVFLTAIVLASAIEPFISRMEKVKVPRVFSVVVVYFILIFFIIGLSVLFIPSIIEQANNFIIELPAYIESFNVWLDSQFGSSSVLSTAVDQLKNKISIFSGTLIDNQVSVPEQNILGGFIVTLFGGLFNFILVLVFSFYLAVQGHGIEKFLKIVSPVKYTKYAINL